MAAPLKRRFLCHTNGMIIVSRNGFIGKGMKLESIPSRISRICIFLCWLKYNLQIFSHETLTEKPVSRWQSEMSGMRDALHEFSKVSFRTVS